jgi:hypothetical protein
LVVADDLAADTLRGPPVRPLLMADDAIAVQASVRCSKAQSVRGWPTGSVECSRADIQNVRWGGRLV